MAIEKEEEYTSKKGKRTNIKNSIKRNKFKKFLAIIIFIVSIILLGLFTFGNTDSIIKIKKSIFPYSSFKKSIPISSPSPLLPDFVIREVKINPSSIEIGDVIKFTAKVENQGEKKKHLIEIALFMESIKDNIKTIVPVKSNEAVITSESNVKFSFSTKNNIQKEGNYKFIIKVDPENKIKEYIETNNEKEIEIYIKKRVKAKSQKQIIYWLTYRNKEYGYTIEYPSYWDYREEIPQGQNLGIKINFSEVGLNNQGKHIFTIQHPIPEIGYEPLAITKTEQIKIQNSEKYLTKQILKPKEQFKNENFNNLVLVSWNLDSWNKSGQISFPFLKDSDPNLEILDQMLSTFKFIELSSDKATSLNTYSDFGAGFTLKYPSALPLRDECSLERKLRIGIDTNKIDLLPDEFPLGYGKETALNDQKLLNQGRFGENIDWPLEISKKVIKIGDKYGKSFVVLGRFEVTDITFERKIIFYNNGYQIEITLYGPTNEIIECPEMSQYFTFDSAGERQWEWENKKKFYQDLISNKAPNVAQDWYNIFDEIVKTIEIK